MCFTFLQMFFFKLLPSSSTLAITNVTFCAPPLPFLVENRAFKTAEMFTRGNEIDAYKGYKMSAHIFFREEATFSCFYILGIEQSLEELQPKVTPVHIYMWWLWLSSVVVESSVELMQIHQHSFGVKAFGLLLIFSRQ